MNELNNYKCIFTYIYIYILYINTIHIDIRVCVYIYIHLGKEGIKAEGKRFNQMVAKWFNQSAFGWGHFVFGK